MKSQQSDKHKACLDASRGGSPVYPALILTLLSTPMGLNHFHFLFFLSLRGKNKKEKHFFLNVQLN